MVRAANLELGWHSAPILRAGHVTSQTYIYIYYLYHGLYILTNQIAQ